MQDPRYKHKYLDSGQIWVMVTRDDESDKYWYALDHSLKWCCFRSTFTWCWDPSFFTKPKKPDKKSFIFWCKMTWGTIFTKVILLLIKKKISKYLYFTSVKKTIFLSLQLNWFQNWFHICHLVQSYQYISSMRKISKVLWFSWRLENKCKTKWQGIQVVMAT